MSSKADKAAREQRKKMIVRVIAFAAGGILLITAILPFFAGLY